jgi:predicted aldo/keto reductase-like oxidoreductase
MPVFSCGGMRYQHSWKDEPWEKIPEAGQANLHATIHRAVELGINHIETARGYGTSEIQLGRVLPGFPRESLILQTKVGPRESGREFLEVFEQSLQNLGVEYVDLLSFHGINTPELLDQVLRQGGCLEAGRELQRQGRARWLGFSTHGSLPLVREAIQTGEFDYVNLHWYWVNQLLSPAIEDAVLQDMGVFIISPNDKGGKLYSPPPRLVDLCRPLSPMAFNNLYCLVHPGIHTLSIGAARPSDFDEHIESLQRLHEAGTLVPAIDQRLRQRMEEALGAGWTRGWQQGIPSWEDIPGHINVWEILRLHNLALALDLLDFAKMRYNLLGNAGHWFPGENAAKFDPGALKKVLSGSPFRDQIPERLREAHALLFEAPKKRLSES